MTQTPPPLVPTLAMTVFGFPPPGQAPRQGPAAGMLRIMHSNVLMDQFWRRHVMIVDKNLRAACFVPGTGGLSW